MDPLREAALRSPNAVALSSATDSTTTTYAELDREVEALARRLASAGATPGSVVATLLPTRPELVQAVFAVPRTGASLAPLRFFMSPFELDRGIGAVRPRVVLCDREAEELAAAQLSPDIALVTVESGIGTRATPLSDLPAHRGDLPQPSEERVFALLWTSGTGGRPHAVEITLGNFIASARASESRLGLGPSDVWYASLSPAFVGGMALLTRAVILGSEVVLTSQFGAEEFNELADSGRITHASLVPTMLHRVLQARGDRPAPDSLECVLLGGAHAPDDLVESALSRGFPLALTYGMTQASSQITTAPPDLVRKKPGTVGAPLPGVEVRIDEGGEIFVRGATIARGYSGSDPGQGFVDGGGWLRTGDLGWLDEDGHLWVTGRLSERIITGGVNVDPGEVERMLRSHPAVQDASVIGLPDPEWGERVVAVLEPVSGERPTLQGLEGFVRERLSPAKRPRQWLFVEAIPRNPNGKVNRRRLEELFEDQRLTMDGEAS